MPTTYPSQPYYDDYNQNKQFYRILFRPGRAVQARELTQLQTLIQAQIERFGNNIFKEGGIVIPASQVYDIQYNFVKLQATYNSVDADDVLANLNGSVVVGRTTGVRALVVNYAASDDTDPPTLYVKYLSASSDGLSTVFSDNEIIDNEAATISVRAISSSATGVGAAYSIGEGVVFVKGNFVYTEDQTKIISKYSLPTDIIVGFQVTESTVTSDDDESLLDPAVGSFNYFAPGADRYKISLTLATREFTPATTDDPNFVELARIEDGEIIYQNKNPEYNLLQDTLARRTFDESGNYTVKPFKLKLIEHLRSTNANVSFTVNDGRYTANAGGNSDLFVNVVSAGKAYVKGYEIDSLKTKYVNAEKARDFVSVNNGSILTEIGNYILVTNVHSIPDLTNIGLVDLYNQYNNTPGTANGTKVGTARVRHLEYVSGTIGSSTAVYRLYLFDVQMDSGYSFVRDVKQVFTNNASIADFTADISPDLTIQNGTVTLVNGSVTIAGVGTRFTNDLKVNDVLTISSGSYRITAIGSDQSANVSPTPSANVSGASYSLQQAEIVDPDKNIYIFPLPYEVIKSLDSTNLETIYSTKRAYSRTLSGGSVTITAGTDELFNPVSTTNYAIVINSGANDGDHISPTGNIVLSGSPTGSSIVVTLSGYTTETITVIATVEKTESAAVEKTKTLVSSATVSYTSQADCTAQEISLGKADIYRVTSVRMSANAFGTAYSSANSTDITDRYTVDNGQRTTFYDLGSVVLKPGAAKPIGPVQITFDYFTHSAGDYFSVESYGDIDYKDIPTFTVGDVDYYLRDCLDFRPRINDAGTGFSSTGSSTTEMPNQGDFFNTDYEYYLPRYDKLVIDSTGKLIYVKGISSLSPKEPPTPENTMALYNYKQRPYVFDVYKDIEIIPVDNKRFTMRDIGRIENRVKNLEYYTSLSLLEKEAQLFQVKDDLGFDRYKNGFVVDGFKGHGVGDPYNPDYAVAIDYSKNEARPLCQTAFVKLNEVNGTTALRTANSYALTGDIVSLPYTHVKFISNEKASKSVNISPFNTFTFVGKMETNPPSDIWFEDNRLPDIYVDVDGNYESLVQEAQAKGTWGTVWGSWRDVQYGNQGNEQVVRERSGIDYSVVETIATTTEDDVVISKSIIPKMRDVDIIVNVEGLKPNTIHYVYFDDRPVTQYCYLSNTTSNASLTMVATSASTNALKSDATGNLDFTFKYTSTVLNLNTGSYMLKVTNSSSNNPVDTDSYAQGLFSSSGELRNVADRITSTRNGMIVSNEVFDTETVVDTQEPNDKTGPDFIEFVTQYAFGTRYSGEKYRYWNTRLREVGITDSTIANMVVSDEFMDLVAPGSITAVDLNTGQLNVPSTANQAAVTLYNELVPLLMYGTSEQSGGRFNDDQNPDSAFQVFYQNDIDSVTAARAIAIQVLTAIANPANGSGSWGDDAESAAARGLNESEPRWDPDDFK